MGLIPRNGCFSLGRGGSGFSVTLLSLAGGSTRGGSAMVPVVRGAGVERVVSNDEVDLEILVSLCGRVGGGPEDFSSFGNGVDAWSVKRTSCWGT